MVLRSVRRPLLAAVLCLASAAAAAQPKPLTVEEIYSYEGWRRFNGSQAATMTWAPAGDPWLSDTHHLWPSPTVIPGSTQGRGRRPEPTGRGCASTPPRARARRSTPTPQLERALVNAGASASNAGNASRQLPSIFNATRDAFLVTLGDDLYVYTLSTRNSDAADQFCRRQERGDFQPRRPQRGVHQEPQYFCREHRRHRRASADRGWQRRTAERHARLGVFRRALRPWQPPRLLVEPRLVPHCVPAVRRESGSGVHARR